MENNFFIEIKNNISEIVKIYELLDNITIKLELSDDIVFKLNLIFDELLTNIISYGYTDNKEHIISINIKKNNVYLEIKIEDDGVEFNPVEREAPDLDKTLEEKEIGGLGIMLVKNFIDEINYKRIDNKNILTLLKKIN
jgi:anti-sigma regulatory factor (Ser/Thr protein kinase)